MPCDVGLGVPLFLNVISWFLGIRGELGSLTVAQITIMKELKDAIRAYDDFLGITQKLVAKS